MLSFGSNEKPTVVRCRMAFPLKLHRLLCDSANQGNEDVIAWSPDGKSFKVHNKQRFANEIMPSYFGSSKYRSFQKNLNMWGFTNIRGGPYNGACFRPLFLRDSRHLCHQISRQRVISKKRVDEMSQQKSDPESSDEATPPENNSGTPSKPVSEKSLLACTPIRSCLERTLKESRMVERPSIANCRAEDHRFAQSIFSAMPMAQRFPVSSMLKNRTRGGDNVFQQDQALGELLMPSPSLSSSGQRSLDQPHKVLSLDRIREPVNETARLLPSLGRVSNTSSGSTTCVPHHAGGFPSTSSRSHYPQKIQLGGTRDGIPTIAAPGFIDNKTLISMLLLERRRRQHHVMEQQAALVEWHLSQEIKQQSIKVQALTDLAHLSRIISAEGDSQNTLL